MALSVVSVKISGKRFLPRRSARLHLTPCRFNLVAQSFAKTSWMGNMLKKIFITMSLLLLIRVAGAQNSDPQLLAEINKIKAIDNHTHPPKVVGPGEKDDDFDALPNHLGW